MSTVTVTHTYTRPNTGVAFYTVYGSDPFKASFRQHWDANYMATGKVVRMSDSLSGNVYTVAAVYSSQQSYDESLADSFCTQMKNAIDSHNAANGIVHETVVS
jgi:hypothetical protein